MTEIDVTRRPDKRRVVGNVKRDLESIGVLLAERNIFGLLDRQRELATLLESSRLPDHKRPQVAMELRMTAAEVDAALAKIVGILQGVGCDLEMSARK